MGRKEVSVDCSALCWFAKKRGDFPPHTDQRGSRKGD